MTKVPLMYIRYKKYLHWIDLGCCLFHIRQVDLDCTFGFYDHLVWKKKIFNSRLDSQNHWRPFLRNVLVRFPHPTIYDLFLEAQYHGIVDVKHSA